MVLWNHGILWLSHHIGNIIIPTDFHSIIFQRDWNSTTNQSNFTNDFHGGMIVLSPARHLAIAGLSTPWCAAILWLDIRTSNDFATDVHPGWIWINLITTSLFSRALGIMVSIGNHPQMAARFRLVKYYNLPRWMRLAYELGPLKWWCVAIDPGKRQIIKQQGSAGL